MRYAITDRALFGGDLQAMLVRLIQIALECDYLQIRERDLSASELEQFTQQLISALQPSPVRPKILVNHRADVAAACGADGVHLRSGSGELTVAQVRQIYERCQLPPPVVSIACHSLQEITHAAGADLILFGPVFEKPLPPPRAPLPGLGVHQLAEGCVAAAPTPVLALGGVTRQNHQQCLNVGAAGVAGIRYFLLPHPIVQNR